MFKNHLYFIKLCSPPAKKQTNKKKQKRKAKKKQKNKQTKNLLRSSYTKILMQTYNKCDFPTSDFNSVVVWMVSTLALISHFNNIFYWPLLRRTPITIGITFTFCYVEECSDTDLWSRTRISNQQTQLLKWIMLQGSRD